MKEKDQDAAAPEESAAGAAATSKSAADETADSPAKSPAKPRARRRARRPKAEPEASVAPTAEEIARVRRMFLRAETADTPERFLFARWSRPIRPLTLGLDAEGATLMSATFAEIAAEAGLETAGPAPSAAPNILLLFCADWSELARTPGLERLIPDLGRLLRTLEATEQDRRRLYNLSAQDGMRLAVALTRFPDGRASAPLETVALGLACRMLLPWADSAFDHGEPVAPRRQGRSGLRRWHSALLKAANDPAMPVWSEDPELAATLAASVSASMTAADAAMTAAEASSDQIAADGPKPDARTPDAPEETADAAGPIIEPGR